MVRYTVKFVAGDRHGSLLVSLPSSQPCSALIDAAKTRIPGLKGYADLNNLGNAEATLHLEGPDGLMLYPADNLAEVLPGENETVAVISDASQAPPSRGNPGPAGVPSLKLRVISPELARTYDIDTIRALKEPIPLSCTLRELKARVQVHVGFPADDGTCPELECNCNLARQIDENAVLNKFGTGDHDASHTVILVHGNNNVLAIPVADITHDTFQNVASTYLMQPNKILTVIGGAKDVARVAGTKRYLKAPRWTHGHAESAHGKAGIVKKSIAWEHPNGQSDRGISNSLSTLRVFANLTASGTMEEDQQDAVLHMIHLLTRFPPAIRTAYILMRGETPSSSERAALAQSLYKVLKSVVPLPVVRSDQKRLLEGTRLLSGLILEKAKNLKVTKFNTPSDLPYVNMKVYDLRNMVTMEPVLSVPVQTQAGLLDFGFYAAFNSDGILSRVAVLSGGSKAHVLGFDFDAVNYNTRYLDCGNVSAVVSEAEHSELSYLAGLCTRNQLSVIAPSALPSATPPVLTLDREGFLAAYIGRADCAEAGRDILMFRPTSLRDEEAVDVSIITQTLEPILAQRNADETAVFEAYGDHHPRVVAPDEIAVICIDLSRSMTERCGFVDVEENEDAQEQILCRSTTLETQDAGSAVKENPAYPLPDSDELKEYLRAHESFEDCLAIIRTGRDDYQRRLNAEKVLDIMQQINTQRIEAQIQEMKNLRRRTTHFHFMTLSADIEREINTIRNRFLRVHRQSHVGLPSTAKFETPREYCCHISSDVMDDPVTTVDNYTYERKNIERW
ncbi:hypothetical protein EK21DRAFT_95249 [Setomelanomma holmii]|uniref:peptidylprolyl isomerase n=1 Tax=Setomelanomma holmii TaxID=210430 RepID=A0A9P4GX20_9PLEO|nr:hypothetical protein EK21DRAFT_95249 [Setomelanomma holmii]